MSDSFPYMAGPYFYADNAQADPGIVINTAGVWKNSLACYQVLKRLCFSDFTVRFQSGFVPGALRRLKIILREPVDAGKKERAVRRFFDIAERTVSADSFFMIWE